MSIPTVVENDPANHRLIIEQDGAVAELVYREEEGRLVIVHTGVPEELSGRGLGGTLVRAAIERAATSGATVVAECPYARAWLDKHPDEASRVTIERSA